MNKANNTDVSGTAQNTPSADVHSASQQMSQSYQQRLSQQVLRQIFASDVPRTGQQHYRFSAARPGQMQDVVLNFSKGTYTRKLDAVIDAGHFSIQSDIEGRRTIMFGSAAGTWSEPSLFDFAGTNVQVDGSYTMKRVIPPKPKPSSNNSSNGYVPTAGTDHDPLEAENEAETQGVVNDYGPDPNM
jgi:hypothetical protein